MNEDSIYKYLGYAVIVIFVFLMLYYLWKVQFNLLYKMKNLTNNNSDSNSNGEDIVEGFSTAPIENTNTPSNSEEYLKVLELTLKKQKNNLLVGKNRRNYENILVNLDEWANVQMFNAATSGAINAKKQDLNSKDIECINCVNGLAKFKKNLANIVEWMDGVKDDE